MGTLLPRRCLMKSFGELVKVDATCVVLPAKTTGSRTYASTRCDSPKSHDSIKLIEMP